MYLVTWIEEEAKVEASLGGRMTREEMNVFVEELQDILSSLEEQPYLLVLDHSKAKRFDPSTQQVLNDLKDFCLANGAAKIVTVLSDEEERTRFISDRLQNIMEGREELHTPEQPIHWTAPIAARTVVLRAA